MTRLGAGLKGTHKVAGGLRVEWLDGVRALAAVFVVLHHVWLMTYGGYPGNNGPWGTDWLIYGHLAVSVFIVVSGFSLMLSPARHELSLRDGGSGFLRRRFWRIVPPYWAALALSVALVALGLIGTPSGNPLGPKDVLVHLFLVQDAVGSTSPNGVFWSIAVEWHIYFLFPLLLMAYRRFGIASVSIAVAALIVLQHIGGQYLPLIGALNRFTPVYLVLFVLGTAAAVAANRRFGSRSGLLIGAFLVASFIATAALAGSEAVIANYFWVDLGVGMATAALFVALSGGRLRWLARILALRMLVFVGQFAFSLYLIHALILELLRSWVVQPLGLTGASAFWLLLGLGLPGAVGVAYLFFLVCERPFLSIRSFRGLRVAMGAAVSRPWASARSRANQVSYPAGMPSLDAVKSSEP